MCIGKGNFFAALVIFSLTGQIAWVVENMYFNVFIGVVVVLTAFLLLVFKKMKTAEAKQ